MVISHRQIHTRLHALLLSAWTVVDLLRFFLTFASLFEMTALCAHIFVLMVQPDSSTAFIIFRAGIACYYLYGTFSSRKVLHHTVMAHLDILLTWFKLVVT